jgi:hypothetical protein
MYSSHCDRYLHVCETFSSFLGEKTDVAIMCPTYKFNINHTRIAMATAAYELW